MHSSKNSLRQVALRPTTLQKITLRKMYSENFSLRTLHLSDPRTPSNALWFPPPDSCAFQAKKKNRQIANRPNALRTPAKCTPATCTPDNFTNI
ncbi:hypothetical protein Nepgr_023138 [Nepenthes gracilis]|uniref:Uncharacterized protein n=1 Tax=Nepenthes gracilis TaxID=150966 RepID=A0AAD3T298_NEPGR|nr:hypothetical protein Nepgr_023138 [Nepenthes gracilis]